MPNIEDLKSVDKNTGEIMAIHESSPIADLVARAEIDQQIATAHKFPRSIRKFRDEAMSMVTLTESIAGECVYALPRDGKTIEGPSARFAEVIASAWGNCRVGARIIGEDDQFVTSQGVFHDLERNSSITYEVRRRITDRNGRKFRPDMIAVTANAASSIALRNAVLKGIPKAFWADPYEAARHTIAGDVRTIVDRRAKAFEHVQKMGITKDMVLDLFGVDGEEDIGQEELIQLRGVITALKDGDTTIEEVFSKKEEKQTKKPAQPVTAQEEIPVQYDAEEVALLHVKVKQEQEEEGPPVKQETELKSDDEKKAGNWTDKVGTLFDPAIHEWDDEMNRPAIARRGRFAGRFIKRKDISEDDEDLMGSKMNASMAESEQEFEDFDIE